MIAEKHLIRALEVAMRAARLDVSEVSELVGQSARVYSFPNRLTNYSFFAADAIFREDGAVVLQETNGSNGASTGMLADGQARRAQHMAAAALASGLAIPCIALLAHADRTGLKPEFYARQTLFAGELEAAGVGTVKARCAGEELGPEDIAVVIGPVSELVEHVDARNGKLYYMGRRIGFAANANILPALQRARKIERSGAGFNVDTGIFHEGLRGVEITLDKGLQQRCAVGTGLTPLRYSECASWESVPAEIGRWHREGLTPVAKINNGSQGVGIAFFPPGGVVDVATELRHMREHAASNYGPEADLTALPLRLFEFAASTRYRLVDGGHLWDVRIECHVSPGSTTLIPASIRICPAPFDAGRFDRNAVLSNLSGRDSGFKFVRTPFDSHGSGKTELEWAGVTEERFSAAMRAFAEWCEAAGGK